LYLFYSKKISDQFDHAIMAAMCNHRINRELWLFFFSAGLVRAGGVYIHPQTRMNPSYGNYLFMRKTNQPLELVGGRNP
jgi:hypothetical protein